MKIKILALLIPWQLSDLVPCKPLVKEFISTVVDSKKSKICTKLHLQLAFEEVVCTEEFANIGLFCKTIVSAGNRKSCANIGRNFKLNYLTEKQCVNETDCYSLGPVGPKMTMKPDGVLLSGMSYKLHERTSSAPPMSGMSGGSETPSLAEFEAANLVAAGAASAAAIPEAVVRGRTLQPATGVGT